MLTLHEFLAGILLEEGLVYDRTGKVVDHELKYGLYLVLRVTSIVRNGGILELLVRDKMTKNNGTYPRSTLQHQPSQVHGSSSNLAGRVGDETMIEAANLKEVLAQGACLDVVVVRL
jgi:hypothetical protein